MFFIFRGMKVYLVFIYVGRLDVVKVYELWSCVVFGSFVLGVLELWVVYVVR